MRNKPTADTGIRTTTFDLPGRAFGAFLRRMRNRATVGAGARTPRRRVAGLRREEVAQAAGISVTWYTWLEQGRPVRVSPSTLDAIADALGLAEVERAHLTLLAAAARVDAPSPITRCASPTVAALVDGLHPHPAYVVNGCWDVLYQNDAARTVFGAFSALDWPAHNVLSRLLLDPEWRTLFVEWDDVCESAVAQFRAATASFIADDGWQGFVARLAEESDAFRALWLRNDLAPSVAKEKLVRHATRGEVRYAYVSLAPDGEPNDVRVIVYVSDAASRPATNPAASSSSRGRTPHAASESAVRPSSANRR
ncbi:MAG: helix-turn-helix transcriptional regulator [bacterium]